jgi:D-alanine transaminase
MPEIACLNGEILPIDQAKVPIEDRGYQFGDAVYEYLTTYSGKIFALEAHLDRLYNSLNALGFPSISRDRIRETITGTHRQSEIDPAGIYLQISRGVAPRNHPFPEKSEPQIVVIVRHLPEIDPQLRETGIRAITVNDIRWGRCDIKTVQLLANAMAKQQALDARADDAIFVSDDDIVREATSSNVFIVTNGTLRTHPLTPNILPGITRAELIKIAKVHDIPTFEALFSKSELLAADEVLLSGTVTEVLPVTQIDDQTIGNGKPGPISRNLYKWLLEET